MNTNDSLDEYMKPIQEIFNSRDSKKNQTNMLAQQVPSHHNTYKGKVPRNCTRKNRKSFKLRVAALAAALSAGALRAFTNAVTDSLVPLSFQLPITRGFLMIDRPH